MKMIGRFAIVVLMLLTVVAGQSVLMAAPTRGAAASSGHSVGLSLFEPMFGILSAIWSGPFRASVNGGTDNPGRSRAHQGNSGGLQQGGSTDSAIWGFCRGLSC